MTYAELVQLRKKYPFENLPPVINNGEKIILKNPSRIKNGIYDTQNELNPWSLWQGDLNAEILVIGQDWGGEICYIEQEGKDIDEDSTNKNLIKLFNSVGIKIRKPSEQYLDKRNQNLFFTNCILGIKEGNKKGDVSKWINVNANNFIKPLIEEILNPKIIITLGLPAYKSLNCIYNICKTNAHIKMGDIICNNPYIVKDKLIFSFYHCGNLGLRNRSLEKQLDDWKILKKYIQH